MTCIVQFVQPYQFTRTISYHKFTSVTEANCVFVIIKEIANDYVTLILYLNKKKQILHFHNKTVYLMRDEFTTKMSLSQYIIVECYNITGHFQTQKDSSYRNHCVACSTPRYAVVKVNNISFRPLSHRGGVGAACACS